MAVLSCLLFISVSSADIAISPWLIPDAPSLIKQFDLSAADPLPSTVAGLGNRDCINQPVVIRPARLLQSQQTVDSCFVSTGFGMADSNGLMRFAGASVSGTAVNYGGYIAGQIPIPASIDVLHYTSAGTNGLYLHLTKNLPEPLVIETALDGKVAYRYSRAADISVRDKSGALLPAQTDSLAFSANGKWLVVDSPNRAVIRVNLETMEVLPFAPAFNYTLGVPPGAQTAISNDGRYAVIASKTFGVMKLYDLSTCGAVPSSITGPVACSSKDLLPIMQTQLTGFTSATQIRFVSSDVLTIYSIVTNAGATQRAKYALVAPGAALRPVTYVGMGDSFSSGEGDNQGALFYEPATNNSTNKCHVSRRSYPYLIAAAVNLNDFHDVACSGAVINDISYFAQYPQINIKPSDWLAGSFKQKEFLFISTPSFLTISIGGNDIGFGDIMAECATSHFKIPLPTTCRQAADPTERANAAKLIADQFPRLIQTYKELVATTNKRTKIYVIGYPKFVKGSGGSCGLNVRLNDQEREFIDKGVTYLNQVIKAAAQNAGVYYVDIEDALEDHNLCSIIPDEQMAVNGLTEGDDKKLPWWAAYAIDAVTGISGLGDLGIANASYHPNAIGQRLMYEKIMDKTGGDPGNFATCPDTQPLCPVNAPIPLPDAAYFGQEARDYAAKFNGVPLPYSIAKPATPSRLLSSQPSNTSQVHVRLDYLKPGSPATISLDSPQTLLKQVTTGNSFSLTEQVTIPANTTPGIHRLQVNATNIAGEQTTYYQAIFVPGPAGDINGNEIPDSQEACGFTPASGLDVDNDNVDDACDGSVAPPLPTLRLSIRNIKAK